MKKYKVLWLSNAPHLATGFSTVAKNMLKSLYNTGKYDFTIIGINFQGEYYDRDEFPYKMYPARMDSTDDIFGMQRFLDFLSSDQFDIAFTLYDPFILEPLGEQMEAFKKESQKKLKWISYYAVDAPQNKEWVTGCISKTDYPVMYTQYGVDMALQQDKALEKKLRYIYHGVDLDTFFPVGKNTTTEFRRRYFKGMVGDDTFLITNVNRHQIRKDLARTMLAFREFKKKVPNSFLYLHSKIQDLGGSIYDKANLLGLKSGIDYSIPGNFSEYVGVPEYVLNMIYNTSDVITSTTLGEGFGLSSIEAMATKTLCVMPDNTALSEILADGRGLKVKCGSTLSEWANFGPTDKDRLRPLTNVDDLIEKWTWAYEHPEEKKQIEQVAYDWAKQYSWKSIGDQWVKLFDEAIQQLEKERNS